MATNTSEPNATSSPTSNEVFDRDMINSLWIYIPPVILAVGYFGNIMSILVLTLRDVCKPPLRFYMISLAVSDTVVLTLGFVRQWMRFTFGKDYDMRLISGYYGCIFHMYSVYFFFQFSSWLVALIGVQRAVVVSMPMKAQSLVTLRISVISVFLLVLVLGCANLTILLKVSFVPASVNKDRCIFSTREAYNLHQVLNLPFLSILPFTIILISTLVIIYKLTLSARFREEQKQGEGSGNQSVTIMLVTVCLVCLITTSPFQLFLARYRRADFADDESIFYFIYCVTSLVLYLNYSVNFYLYVLSGQKFRNAFFDLLGKKKP